MILKIIDILDATQSEFRLVPTLINESILEYGEFDGNIDQPTYIDDDGIEITFSKTMERYKYVYAYELGDMVLYIDTEDINMFCDSTNFRIEYKDVVKNCIKTYMREHNINRLCI